MPESYQWQGALSSLGVEALARKPDADACVFLRERRAGAQLALRGDAADPRFADAAAEVLGVALPATPGTAQHGPGTTALWLGPDEWLVVMAREHDAELASALADAMDGVHHAAVDVSHSRAIVGIGGMHARDVLMKGTNVDLHPRVFGPDRCVQARLARCHVLLHQIDDAPSYDVYVHRSFAVYAWRWLSDAAREYGLAVEGAGR